MARTEVPFRGGLEIAGKISKFNSDFRSDIERINNVSISIVGRSVIVKDRQSSNPKHANAVRSVKAALSAAKLELA